MSDSVKPANRLVWIDILRGVAVIGMVQTHVWNAFLHPFYDAEGWRQEWGFLSGLLAPAFLWIAGYIQGRSVRKAHRESRPVVTVPRLRRLGIIVMLAYGLHVPWNFWLAGDFSRESWRIFLQADILQCMTVSLTLLLLMGRLGSRWFDLLALLGIAFAVFAAPAAQQWQTGTLLLDAFLNHNTGSLFPLFPWFGFCAAGCLASRWEVSWKTCLPWALAFIAVGLWLTPHGYIQPSFFFKRLGWLGLLVTATSVISPVFAPRWVQLAGRESLLIYVVHLLLIFSLPLHGLPLNQTLGQTQSLWSSEIIFLAVLSVSLALAWGNDWRKQRQSPGKPQ
ncbi:MAG: hypothetical protein RL693_1805 [Verrucomicrobiota bacterium]|jgi:uncharacterized membrane protein